MSSYRSSTFAIAVVAFAHCAMAGFVSAEPKADSKNDAAASTTAPAMTMETFLDRLMMAEFGRQCLREQSEIDGAWTVSVHCGDVARGREGVFRRRDRKAEAT